jgi:hypothetical protein
MSFEPIEIAIMPVSVKSLDAVKGLRNGQAIWYSVHFPFAASFSTCSAFSAGPQGGAWKALSGRGARS